ncbi:MAG: dihydrofolate reductase family protein [Clostridiaceae bacterium]
MKRNVVVYIATSIDGYIASKNDDISWLSIVETEGEDYGYSEFIKTIDTVIMGRKTYDKVTEITSEFPHAEKVCFVITRDKRERNENVQFYNRDLTELIVNLKEARGKDIFIDGGAEVINELIRNDLIDEITISIIPVILGDGIRLFNEGLELNKKFNLEFSKSYSSGLVQVKYRK